MLAKLSVHAAIDVDHLELSPIFNIIVSWVTDISGEDDKDTKFSGFSIKLDVDYRDVLRTEETSDMPKIQASSAIWK